MTLIDDLKEARRLVALGDCKGAFARGTNGLGLMSMDDRAVCFCLRGAVNRACGYDFGRAKLADDALMQAAGPYEHSLMAWSDGHTLDERLELIDRAIVTAEGGEDQ